MRAFFSIAVNVATLAYVATAHDFDVEDINPSLGVWGYPDCTQTQNIPSNLNDIHPEEMSQTLQCFQSTGRPGAIKVGCIGDSITAGVHSSGGNHTYPAQLQIMLGDGYVVTNLGACGSTMMKSGNSPYWERPQYDTLTNSAWDIVIIMLGTNDSKDAGSQGPSNWPHNCTGEGSHTCPFARDYASMIELVRTLGSKEDESPDIYLAIPPPLMQKDAYGMNETVINRVFPDLVPTIAADNNITNEPIDVFGALGGHMQRDFPKDGCTLDTPNAAKCAYYCDAQSCDQCHPDDDGYHAMAETVMHAILKDRVVK